MDHNFHQWLTEVQIISETLKKIYSDVSVSVYREGLKEWDSDEESYMGSGYGYSRQVFILGNKYPQVFGEVAVPIDIYSKYKKDFENLRNKPIGVTLLYNRNLNFKLWKRRSFFYKNNRIFLTVTETFFPHIKKAEIPVKMANYH